MIIRYLVSGGRTGRSAVVRRRASMLAVVGVALGLAACGGSTGRAAPAGTASSAGRSAADPSAVAAAAAAGRGAAVAGAGTAAADGDGAGLRTAPMHGLVVLTRQSLRQPPPNIRIWLVARDPRSGAQLATRYFFPTAGVQLGFSERHQTTFQRQWFAKDYTITSATSGADANGITYPGVVRTGDSQFTPLTRTSSGYGTLKSKDAGPFNPRTGRLWFTTERATLGSVDPLIGAPSERTEPGGVQTIFGSVALYGFTPTGFGPVWDTSQSLGTTLYFPDGTMMVRNVDGFGFGYVFGKEGTLGPDSGPALDLPAGVQGFPAAVIDRSRFLLTTIGSTGLYAVTHTGTRLTAVKLLPDSNKKILSMVVSPRHDQVAFMSSDGGLYVTGLTGVSEPRRVMDLPQTVDNQENMLLDWLP